MAIPGHQHKTDRRRLPTEPPLTDFAARLSDDDDRPPRLPEFVENEGVAPVLGTGLADEHALARWIGARIREVEHLSGSLPTIAVLVNSREELEPLAEALNADLAEMNIRAVACPGGPSDRSGK